MPNDWDFADMRSSAGKCYMLRFLPYLETPSGEKVEAVIGYNPTRGYGYGSWEEFFVSLPDAQERMAFLISAQVVETVELRKEIPGGGWCTTLVDEWSDRTGS